MHRHVHLVAATLVCCLVSASTRADEPWKTDARTCGQMSGAPGDAYRATCKDHDQFDSILACEQAAGDNDAADRIQRAGRDDVNAYMQGFGPVEGCM